MELKDFIAETIIQINQGLAEAQEKTKEYGTVINPHIRGGGDNFLITHTEHDIYSAQGIEFDVCLTVEESQGSDKKGKLELAAGIFKLGGQDKKSETAKNQEVNRIKFSIPILWGPQG